MGKSVIFLLYVVCGMFCCCDNDEEIQIKYKVVGETITLTGQEWNQLWKNDISNLTLYGIESNGTKVIYQPNIDYLILGNKVKRTPNSRIVDFGLHKIIYDDNGKFKWWAVPNRNPELSLPYQIYADYDYTDFSIEVKPADKMTQRLKDKITKQQSLKIATVGTSISFGSHTFEHYYHNSDVQTYHQLVSKALLTHCGIDCKSVNYSTDGGGVNQIQDLTRILVEKPDVVFIELGMNDHLGLNPNINYYKSSLEKSIVKFKENEIDVVLVGFFQQIDSWELETPSNTILFNKILSELVQKYNIYFADIYSNFEKIDKNKLYKDYTGDYMHHPTSFAHQLYYLEIMPFFIDKPIIKDQQLQWIY